MTNLCHYAKQGTSVGKSLRLITCQSQVASAKIMVTCPGKVLSLPRQEVNLASKTGKLKIKCSASEVPVIGSVSLLSVQARNDS